MQTQLLTNLHHQKIPSRVDKGMVMFSQLNCTAITMLQNLVRLKPKSYTDKGKGKVNETECDPLRASVVRRILLSEGNQNSKLY